MPWGSPGVRADAPRERLHPRAQQGHHALRGLQRRTANTGLLAATAVGSRGEPLSAHGSPTGSAAPGAWTSSSTAASSASRSRTSSGQTAGSRSTATPRSLLAECCRSSARSSRCRPESLGCRSGASALLSGLHPVVAHAHLHRQAGGRQLGEVEGQPPPVDYAVLAAIVIGVVWLVVRNRRASAEPERHGGETLKPDLFVDLRGDSTMFTDAVLARGCASPARLGASGRLRAWWPTCARFCPTCWPARRSSPTSQAPSLGRLVRERGSPGGGEGVAPDAAPLTLILPRSTPAVAGLMDAIAAGLGEGAPSACGRATAPRR